MWNHSNVDVVSGLGLQVPDHEDTEMALYADKVTMDYRPALHDSSTHDSAMDHRSAFRPAAGIGVRDGRDGPSVGTLSTNGGNGRSPE